MSVNVAAGQIWMPGTLGSVSGMPSGVTSQGSYYGYNDATINLAISASNPTNPRIDLLVATVRDAEYAGSDNDWVIQVVTGTPAASPAPPTAPANSIVLAQVAVAANASSIVAGNITDKRTYVGLAVPSAGHQFQVHLASAQSVANGATATINLDTVDTDPAGGWSASTHLYTIPAGAGGLWQFTALIRWATNTTGVRCLIIAGGGGLSLNAFNWITAADDVGGVGRMSVATTALVSAGNSVGLQALQTSGGSLSTGTGVGAVQLSGVRVG